MKKHHILFLWSTILILNIVSYSVTAARWMENLDRGVVAVSLGGKKVYIGWRMFGTDPDTIGFNIYRDSVKINASPITGSTNYTDNNGSASSTYSVAPVIDGLEQEASVPVDIWADQYLDIPLQVPAGGTTPDGVSYTYSPNDASVGDLDGDGQYEIVLKWDPSNAKDNSQSGYTGNVYLDAYELDGTILWRIDLGVNIRAGAHYTQFMVYDFDSDGFAEVACKTADGTVDGLDTVIGDPHADWRNSSGYILSGPEYFTVFDGQTGAAIDTVDYIVPRGNVCDWGDCYGNRVDRFLACVAYLDGIEPSIVMCRGYYTRATLTAWDFRDGQLIQRWLFDSYDGTPGNSAYSGQGNHNLSVGDVDNDGKDEIMYGACAIDDDGTGLYSTGYGHGDAMHLSDLDPSRPGLEVFTIHEGSGPGSTFRDAGTGEILWETDPADVGRCVSADIDASYPGAECWGFGGLRSCTNDLISSSSPSSTNFVVLWDADLLSELLNSNVITKHGGSTLLTAVGCSSNNGTKSTPCLSADILGDWREEVIWRTTDNQSLRIYTTTDVTTHRIYTLMHDPQYRLAVAWQNVAYNQPPHTGFFFGDGMAAPPVPDIILVETQLLYGDFNIDFYVNMQDLLYFLGFWLESDCGLTAELDLNDDCIINNYEFSVFARNWTPDTTPPSAPMGVSATAGNNTILLDWYDRGENDLAGYNVYRSVISGSDYTLLNPSLLTNSDYVDNDVVNGTTYYYVVTALDTGANESENSSEASATPTSPILVVYYEMEDNVDDSSGNANHATAAGTPVYTTGYTGQAIDLDGIDDFITLPDNIANSDDITIAAWVNWNGGDSWQRIFDFGNNTTEYLFLTPSSGSSNTLRFAITTSSSGGEQIVETSQLAIDQWVHVTVKLEGNTATLYVDGIPAATNNLVAINPTDIVPVNNYIGQSQWSDPLFDGLIDDFRIYNYALGDAEIRDLATDGDTVQAESALYGGGAIFENSNSGFVGTGYINFPTSGGYLEFTGIDGGAGGDTSLDIRYALGVAGTRTGNLIVNGVPQSITFDSTSAWTTWDIKHLTVTLNSGTNNTIRFESNGEDLANIDEIAVGP